MIDGRHALSIMRQAQLLELSRWAVYYRPQPTATADVALMRRIDELHLEHPFAGSRMLRDLVRQEGYAVGRKHVATLMRTMGIEALYRKANTSRRHPEHRSIRTAHRPPEPSLGDGHHVPADGTRLRLSRRGAGLGIRRILAWRLSNTLTADFCVEALDGAITRYGVPKIMNTDQGSQFTGAEFIGTLEPHHIAISMDGKGCWRRSICMPTIPCLPPKKP